MVTGAGGALSTSSPAAREGAGSSGGRSWWCAPSAGGQLRVSVRWRGLVAGTHGVAGGRANCGHTGGCAPPYLPQGRAQQCRLLRAAGPAGAGASCKQVPQGRPVTADRAGAGPTAAAGAGGWHVCLWPQGLAVGTWQWRPGTGRVSAQPARLAAGEPRGAARDRTRDRSGPPSSFQDSGCRLALL